jgi:hypothetical protein
MNQVYSKIRGRCEHDAVSGRVNMYIYHANHHLIYQLGANHHLIYQSQWFPKEDWNLKFTDGDGHDVMAIAQMGSCWIKMKIW